MVKTQLKVLPQLRFPEFDGEWEVIRLGKIAEFLKGKGISKSNIVDEGKNACIRYGELYTTYNEVIDTIVSKTNVKLSNSVLSEVNDVIIPSSGETRLDIATASCVLIRGVILGGDLNIIRTKLNGVFLSYLLSNNKKKDIAKLAQGNSVVHLYNRQLATLNLNLPSLPEQQKIASFLSAVDQKIQQLTQKKELLEQYKKGVMQQLFSQKLRFKKEDGTPYPDWEEGKFSKFIRLYRGSSPRPIVKYVTTDVDGVNWIKIGDTKKSNNYRIRSVSEKITKEGALKSRYVKKGEIILANSMSFGKSYLLQIDGCIYDGWFVLREYEKSFDKEFILQVLNSEFLQKQYLKLSTGGVVQNISSDIVYSTLLFCPVIEEQKKIADYLSAIDAKIAHVDQQVTQTQTFKKGLLQQLFV